MPWLWCSQTLQYGMPLVCLICFFFAAATAIGTNAEPRRPSFARVTEAECMLARSHHGFLIPLLECSLPQL